MTLTCADPKQGAELEIDVDGVKLGRLLDRQQVTPTDWRLQPC